MKGKIKRLCIGILTFLISVSVVMSVGAEDNTLAFPGAEGGGKYSPGARGAGSGNISVYHVTNLNDSGKGSFKDAVSKEGRIIVFDVSGTIELKNTFGINKNNITILGQTAPGDGITISGADMLIGNEVKNIIMRYIKVRPTDKIGLEFDGIGGRFNSNVIIDHCSASWGVDELLTLYAGAAQDRDWVGNHLTMQNTLGAESLRMSNHAKGAHGYGGIWGGTDSSYVFNLLAHHDSRSPRLDRQLQRTDVGNNVIYDWGQTNSAYGAEPYASGLDSNKVLQKNPSIVNYVGNYYKYGPATAEKLKKRIFEITSPVSEKDPKSQFYFYNNYVEGYPDVTADNTKGLENASGAELLKTEIDMGEYAVERLSAEEAYDYVLANVGATLPRRDATDARIINDVKNGTGRLVNNASEVGGLIPVPEEHRKFEIPAEWLEENGLSGKEETDIVADGKFAGYTVIEAYVNDWTEEQSKTPPTNPNIVVQSPAIASLNNTIEGLEVNNGEWTVINDNEEVNYKATAIAVGGNEVTKMELYDRDTLIDSFEGNVIDTSFTLGAGEHYLTCRAYNTRGEQTQSTTAIVYVKSTAASGSYSFAEIRDASYKGYQGKGGAAMDDDGVYSIYGSGRITTKSSDSCGFMYKPVTGDFDVTVRVEEIPKFENQQVSGLMVRSSLDSNAVMAMIGDGWIKYGENVRVFSRATARASAQEIYFKNKEGVVCENDGDKASFPMSKYMRIQRKGNELTFSVSNAGLNWTDNDRQPMTIKYNNLPDTMYVGLATDSANGVSTKECFSTAKFSSLTLNGKSDVVIEEGKVPFKDTRFNNTEWFFDNGGGEKYFSKSLGGNNGYAALFWGVASRRFNAQNDGVVTATADFYTVRYSSSTVNNRAGLRFMLNGVDENGDTQKIKSVYAQYNKGFFIDYDDTEHPIPATKYNEDKEPESEADELPPDFEAKFEFDKWYKVEIRLDYETGKGSYSFKPYKAYDSQNNIYVTGDSILDFPFDFDTSIAISQLHFQRFGGYEMYLDNVGLDVYVRPVLYIENGKLVVDRPRFDGTLYMAEYAESGILNKVELTDVNANERIEFDKPEVSGANKLKAYLWKRGSYQPICKGLDIQ